MTCLLVGRLCLKLVASSFGCTVERARIAVPPADHWLSCENYHYITLFNLCFCIKLDYSIFIKKNWETVSILSHRDTLWLAWEVSVCCGAVTISSLLPLLLRWRTALCVVCHPVSPGLSYEISYIVKLAPWDHTFSLSFSLTLSSASVNGPCHWLPSFPAN